MCLEVSKAVEQLLLSASLWKKILVNFPTIVRSFSNLAGTGSCFTAKVGLPTVPRSNAIALVTWSSLSSGLNSVPGPPNHRGSAVSCRLLDWFILYIHVIFPPCPDLCNYNWSWWLNWQNSQHYPRIVSVQEFANLLQPMISIIYSLLTINEDDQNQIFPMPLISEKSRTLFSALASSEPGCGIPIPISELGKGGPSVSGGDNNGYSPSAFWHDWAVAGWLQHIALGTTTPSLRCIWENNLGIEAAALFYSMAVTWWHGTRNKSRWLGLATVATN